MLHQVMAHPLTVRKENLAKGANTTPGSCLIQRLPRMAVKTLWSPTGTRCRSYQGVLIPTARVCGAPPLGTDSGQPPNHRVYTATQGLLLLIESPSTSPLWFGLWGGGQAPPPPNLLGCAMAVVVVVPALAPGVYCQGPSLAWPYSRHQILLPSARHSKSGEGRPFLSCRGHMSLKRTAQNSFFGTEILGTMPTLGDSHSSNFAGNIVSNGSNHPPPIRSVASDIGSVFPDRSVGALHPQLWSAVCNHSSEAVLPTSEAFLEPMLGANARCEVCTIPRDDHTMTPPPPPLKHLICQKTPNSPPLQPPPQPPSPIFKVD